jgi:hypothetical protein
LLFFCSFFSVCDIPEVLEETTDAWGFEKPSTSGIPQTLKKGQKKSFAVSCFSLTQRFSNSPLRIPLLIPYTPCFQEIVLTFCGVCGIPEVLGFSNPHASVVSS